jgi:hypothetical protein
MRETVLGVKYELKNVSGSHDQAIVFSTEDQDGTVPIEVLNALVEKLYADQFHNFSCETATAIEFLKAARRIIVKQSVKFKDEHRKISQD